MTAVSPITTPIESNLLLLVNRVDLTTVVDPHDRRNVDLDGSIPDFPPPPYEAPSHTLPLRGDEFGGQQAHFAVLENTRAVFGSAPAHLPVPSSGISTPNGSGTIIESNFGDVVGSTISNIGYKFTKTHGSLSSSGVSTHNNGAGTVIKNKIGNVVGSTISNIGNNNFKPKEDYLRKKTPAWLPSTSGISTPNHGSRTEIITDVGNVVGSTISNIGNDNSNTDGLYFILSILILFGAPIQVVYSILSGQ